jgi:hypothetical protein
MTESVALGVLGLEVPRGTHIVAGMPYYRA